tara:strand:+ start:361 stop:768 length:408 start_codon:yes stop_codon:yes gene_type:complete
MTNLIQTSKAKYKVNQQVWIVDTYKCVTIIEKIKSQKTGNYQYLILNNPTGEVSQYLEIELESHVDRIYKENKIKKFIDNAMDFNGLKSYLEVSETLGKLKTYRDWSVYVPEESQDKLNLYIANLELILKANGYR